MKHFKKVALLILLAGVAAFGASTLYFEVCGRVVQAVNFHCNNGDVDACQESMRFENLYCEGYENR